MEDRETDEVREALSRGDPWRRSIEIIGRFSRKKAKKGGAKMGFLVRFRPYLFPTVKNSGITNAPTFL